MTDFANQILCGDCRVVMPRLPAESVHLIVTSPPYNIGVDYGTYTDAAPFDDYLAWLNAVFIACKRVLVDGGRLAVNIGENNRSADNTPLFARLACLLLDMGLLYRGTVIWEKGNAANMCAWGSWLSASNPHVVPMHEYILLFSKGQYALDGAGPSEISSEQFKRCARATWTFTPQTKSVGHPAPFPLELPSRCIEFFTAPGMIILDPLCGSGTSCVAAKKLGRRWIGIEIDEGYCEIARERVASTPKPLFVS